MAIYYTFNLPPCSGGHFVNLDHIYTLRRWGFDARILFNGDRPEDAHCFGDLPVQSCFEPMFIDEQEDIFVIAENATGIFKQSSDPNHSLYRARSVMHNQNQLYLYPCGSAEEVNHHPMRFMIVPSEYAARRVREMGITKPLRVVRPFIPTFFAPSEKQREPVLIVYSSRKRDLDIHNLKFYFNAHNQVNVPLKFVDMVGIAREDVAKLMSRAAIYLSFAKEESLGLMALEAMASGCHVVGFTGILGDKCEYYTKENGDWIEEGDYLSFSTKLSEAIALFVSGAPNPKIQAGIATVQQFFNQHQFEQSLKGVYEELLGLPIKG